MFHQVRDSVSRRIHGHVFYGWPMLGIAALAMFVSGPGQSHTFSVFLTPIEQDLSLSRTAISVAYALATLVASFGLPYLGRLVDRHGVRVVLAWVAVSFGASAVAFGTVANLLWLGLGFGALRFLGQGSLMLNARVLVAQWFHRRRGFAFSMMMLGFSVSVAVHPPLAQWLIDQIGWRYTWVCLGIMTWVLLVPITVLLVQNKPEDLGSRPDGVRPAATREPVSTTSFADGADVGLSLAEAMRTSAFWIIGVSLSIGSMLVTGMFIYQVSVFETQGVSAQTAAQMFSISAVMMVITLPLFGAMIDRFPIKVMYSASLLLMTAALIGLAYVTDLLSATVYGVLFGLANGGFQAHYGYMWPHYFGRRHLGSIQGAAQTIGVVGASIGPIPFGIAYDLFGTYAGLLFALATLPIVSLLAVWLLKPPVLVKH